jgi:hypothetical protein
VEEIYRTSTLERKGHADWKDQELHGIPVTRYGIRDKDLMNVTENPENERYFSYGPKGIFNFSQIAGFPFFVSKPHFLDGDARLFEAVHGLSPNRTLHDTWILRNDLVGLTVAAHQALQLNARLSDLQLPGGNCILGMQLCCSNEQLSKWDGSFNIFKAADMTETYVPMAYVVETFSVTEDMAKQLRLANVMHRHGPTYSIVFGIVFAGLFGILLGFLIVKRSKLNAQKRLVDNSVMESG